MSIDFECPNLLDEYLSGTNQNQINSQSNFDNVNIENELNIFDPEPMSSNENIINYWHSQKSKESHLYKLSTCIYAIPPTEVEIERDFSKLNFIYTQRRHSLSERNLEAILRIHLNEDLFFIIKEEELLKLKQNVVLS